MTVTTLSDELRTRIQALPFADRVCLLTASIIARDAEAIRALFGLMDLLLRMSQSFDIEDRVRLAEILRTVADRVEFEHESEPQPTNAVALLLNERKVSRK